MAYLLKLCISTLTIICCLSAQAQIKLSKKNIECTTWAVINTDSSFYKLENIKIVQLIDTKSSNLNDSKNVSEYFKDNNFITMQFKKNHELEFYETNVDSWEIVKKKGKYSWNFSKGRQALRLYFNSQLFATLKPVSQYQVYLKSEYIENPLIASVEMVMKKN